MQSEPDGRAPDVLAQRVQRDIQRLVLGKLLHDLRNPIHSLRISMELFGRLARAEGDFDKLVERAGVYIGPAQAALQSLEASCARLATYLTVPAAPSPGAVNIDEVLGEISVLVRGACRDLQVTHLPPSAGPVLMAIADRAWLSHLLLHVCLSTAGARVWLGGQAQQQWIDVQLQVESTRQTPVEDFVAPLSCEELRCLTQCAAGSLQRCEPHCLQLRFTRSQRPSASVAAGL